MLGQDGIRLSKFGWLRIVRHRKIKDWMRNVTLTREGDLWFAVIQIEIDGNDTVLRTELLAVGLDVGITRPIGRPTDVRSLRHR